jgi:hypothetical protein
VLRRWRRLRRLQLCLRWRTLLRDEPIEETILPAEEVVGKEREGDWEFVNCEGLRGQMDYWHHFVFTPTF